MFFIFLGHCTTSAGLAYSWVFLFHVPLFFFLSGCTENFNSRSFIANLKHRFCSIVIPYFFFSFLVALFEMVNCDTTSFFVANFIEMIRGGVRNTIRNAGSLWFFPCLFVVQVVFFPLKKIRPKFLIFCISFFIYIAASKCLFVNEASKYYLPWNLDWACIYQFYYIIGYLSFHLLRKMDQDNTLRCNIVQLVLTLVSGLYSVKLFSGDNMFDFLVRVADGSRLLFHLLSETRSVLTALVSILFVVCLSMYFQNNVTLQRIGKESLFLCGNEFLGRTLLYFSLSLFGIELHFTQSYIQAYIYVGILILYIYKVFVPVEKPMLKAFQRAVSRIIE